MSRVEQLKQQKEWIATRARQERIKGLSYKEILEKYGDDGEAIAMLAFGGRE